MKKILILSLIAIIGNKCFAQHMQDFNQLYSQKTYGKYDSEKDEIYNEKSDSLSKQLKDSTAVKLKNQQSTQIDEAAALPAFTDLLNNNELIPKIELRGMTNFKASNLLYGDIKLFTTVMPAKQSSYVNVFFPDASSYGISASINVLWPTSHVYLTKDDKPQLAKWLCGYLNLNYLGKSLYGVNTDNNKTDTTHFTSAFTHIKVGVQVIPLKNILSFYGDFNGLLAVTNREPLEKHSPSLANGFTNFFTVGTRMFFTKGEDGKPLNIFLDFNAAIMNSNMKKIYNTTDKIIPKISIGGTIKF